MQEITLKNLTKDYRSNEAYKTLRTNIEFSGSDKRVIVFTSCTPNEGKSTVSLSLAASLAEGEKRVLFIDADLRKSVLMGRHKIIGDLNGLSHFLSGQAELKDVICKTQNQGLSVILAGVVPPNPAELLEDKLFDELMEEARKQYDYILVDTPPMGNLIDGAIVASKCDGAVLVIESGGVSYRLAQKVKSQLERSGCRLLGAVLSKTGEERSGRYYNRYYKKYYGKKYDKYKPYEEEKK